MPAFKRTAFLAWFILNHAAAATAGNVSVDVSATSATVVVNAENATVDEILDTLAARGTFELERVGEVDLPRAITHTYTGTTRQIVDHLLKNESYIVQSSDSSGSLARVVVYARPSTATTAGAAQPLQPQAQPAATPRAVRNTVPDAAPLKPAADPTRPPITNSRRTMASKTALTARNPQQ